MTVNLVNEHFCSVVLFQESILMCKYLLSKILEFYLFGGLQMQIV